MSNPSSSRCHCMPGVAEVSEELPGGGWYDRGYFIRDEDARAFAALPQLLLDLESACVAGR